MATLAELAQAYLNQKLPDISGIFSLPQATTPVTGPIVQEPITAPGLTPEQLRLLYSQQSGGGGERDNYIGGGIFGNLDLSRSKTFTKDVFKEVRPGDYSFEPEEIEAFYNPQLGNYQTLEGKNINPAFSNTGATFGIGGGIMNMLGMTPKPIQGFVPGSIRGFYDSPMDIFTKKRNEQSRTTFQKAKSLKEDRERAEQLRAMREVASAPASTYRPGTTTRPGSGGGKRDEGSSPSPSPARTSQGVTSAQHSAFRN